MSTVDKLIFACTVFSILAFAFILFALWVMPSFALQKSPGVPVAAALAKQATTSEDLQGRAEAIELPDDAILQNKTNYSSSSEPPPKSFQYTRKTR